MGDHKELRGEVAVNELQAIIKHQGVCMMVTDPAHYPGHTRPMAVAEVDDAGAFWFLSLQDSGKFRDIATDPRASLYFSNPSDQEFLVVHGNITVLNDMERKKELWNPLAKAWVEDGVEDPDLRILKLTPDDGYYWDTKDGKVVAGIKIAFAAMTGKASDDGGVEGRVRV